MLFLYVVFSVVRWSVGINKIKKNEYFCRKKRIFWDVTQELLMAKQECPMRVLILIRV